MPEAVIVSAVRTPVGRYGGALKDVSAQDLAALVLGEAVKRAGIDPGLVEEVIMGHVLVNGEAPNIARLGALKAGLPMETPAYTLDRQCGSGLQAIVNAYCLIKAGESEVVLAGGVESMSNCEFYVTGARWGIRLGTRQFYDRFQRTVDMVSCPDVFGPISGMIETAENVAEKCNITREDQDVFAVRSHEKACGAIQDGRFKKEIVPVEVKGKKKTVFVDTDEHPRPEITLEALSKLKPVQGKTVTAGNASGMNDGAAACLIMSEEKALKLGLEPMGYIKGFAAGAVHPAYMGLGPVPAVKKLLSRTGVNLGDIDLIELNEAFASQALGVIRELGIKNTDNINVNGSGISLGHPLGATGARIMATLLYEMERRDARFGLETMCIGGGQGLAAIVERRKP